MAELIARSLQKKANESGLSVIIAINENGMLTVKHRHYGSRPNFAVSTNLSGLFGEKPGTIKLSSGGQDVSGYIQGHLALGEGQFLHGAQGTPTEGIIVQYDKELGHRVEYIRDEQGRVIGQKLVKQTNEEMVGKDAVSYTHLTLPPTPYV